MAGPNEQKLHKAMSAQPGQIDAAAQAWKHGAQGLADISEALASARSRIDEAWQGTGADAATAAFTKLGTAVDTYRDKMDKASTALTEAATALQQAKQDYQALPPVPGEPTAPTPGAGGEVSTQDEVHYLRLQGQRRDAQLRREQEATAAVTKMDSGLAAASRQMTFAAPAPHTTDSGGTRVSNPPTTRTTGPAGGSTGYTGPGVTGSHVGPYATSDTGTHVATGHLLGSSQVAFGHGHSDVSVDGTVSGFVPGGTGSVLGSGPHLSGSTGGVAAGAVGGVGGLLGGAGGVLGALGGRGGSAGTAGGVLGGIRGGTSQVLGGAAAEAGELGGTTGAAAPRTSGVLGGTRGTNVVGGSSGARAGVVAGEGEPGMSGTGARGVTGGTGTTGSTTGRAGTAGGRGLSGAAAEEAGGTRGTTTAGGAGRGGAQGAAGGRSDEKDARRKHLKFEDDWLDEDEMGPGVIA